MCNSMMDGDVSSRGIFPRLKGREINQTDGAGVMTGNCYPDSESETENMANVHHPRKLRSRLMGAAAPQPGTLLLCENT